ncbi:MAG: hypothetical protein AAF355_03495 [Myxococcota bacterium]
MRAPWSFSEVVPSHQIWAHPPSKAEGPPLFRTISVRKARSGEVAAWYGVAGLKPPIDPRAKFRRMLKLLPPDVNGFQGIYGEDGTLVLHPSRHVGQVDDFHDVYDWELAVQTRCISQGLVPRQHGHVKVLFKLLALTNGMTRVSGPQQEQAVEERLRFTEGQIRTRGLVGFAFTFKRRRDGGFDGTLYWTSRQLNCLIPNADGSAPPEARQAIEVAMREIFPGTLRSAAPNPPGCK